MKIGIDLGGSHIAIGVVDSKGRILEKMEKRLKAVEKRQIKKSIEEYIVETVEILRKKHRISGIGIAIPGTVNETTVINSVNLKLKNYNIVEDLQKRINLPIKIKNDSKCAAIAENTYGSLKNYNRSLFLTLGTGIGGAVIINKKIMDCGNLPGCEIGHMVIEKNGKLCNCGRRGCFERYASMKALKDNLRETLGYDENVSGKELLEIIRNEKSKQIDNIIQNFIEYLALGIANLINIFEPEAISIGGSFDYFEEVLLDRLKKELLKENVLLNKREDIIVKTAMFRNDAGIIGATIYN